MLMRVVSHITIPRHLVTSPFTHVAAYSRLQALSPSYSYVCLPHEVIALRTSVPWPKLRLVPSSLDFFLPQPVRLCSLSILDTTF